ncbi:MAG TPA: acylphosphatase [Flavisolibacter sp.]|jgi:acylphosphatase|nr:acylphosphatase [Flavisolibacter sp.]
MKTVHILIKGKVQGVFYRASAKKVARELLLKGWIKNTDDGDVESMVSGEPGAVNRFIEWCKKGPPLASVTEVTVTPSDNALLETFTIMKD